MVSTLQVVTAMSYGFVLCLSLSNATQAAEKIKPNECVQMKGGGRDLVKCEEDRKSGIDTVKGEVLDIEEGTYVIQRFYGKKLQLKSDASTQVTGPINLGDSVEAKVIEDNDQKYVMTIRPIQK